MGGGFSLEQVLGEVAAHYLKRADEEAKGVKSQAAALLGFEHYQTYDNWYRKYVGQK
jgi:hypothetical protein